MANLFFSGSPAHTLKPNDCKWMVCVCKVEMVCGGEFKTCKVTDSALTAPHTERRELEYFQISSVSYNENKRHILVVIQYTSIITELWTWGHVDGFLSKGRK